MKGFLFLQFAIAIASDIFIRQNLLSQSQCKRIREEIEDLNHTQLIPVNGTTDVLFYQIVSSSLELYLEQMHFPVLPNISRDTGYARARLNDTFISREMYVGLSNAYIGMYVFLNGYNDIGGEFIFPRQNTTIAPECGKAFLFPSFFTHPYLITPIKSGHHVDIMSTWFK